MADEQIVTNIVATSDFSGLIADVQRTTSALTKLQQELSLSNKTLAAQAGQIQKSFGETLRSTGQFTTHFVTVGSEIDKFGKNLDAGKLKLKDYFGTWQQHTKTSGGLIRDLAKQQVALQNAIVQPLGKSADGLMKFNVHVANGLDATANKTALARKEMQIYNKVIQDGGVQLINWGKNTQWAGRQLTVGLTVPIAAFGAAAQKAFREADAELVRLTKVYGGLTATSATELAKVRKDVSATARELSAAYGTSYKDTISLAADLAATGKQGNDLLLATKEATRLSVLGEVDRQDAMKATLAIQNAFKQNTTELTQSIDFLNAVENQTSTSLGDLIEAIPKAGPVIKAMGGSVKDLALYLTAMKEGGINASEGANALKSALASLVNPTKVAKDMFKGFGIDLSGIVTKNAGNLTGTILELQSALDKLDPLKKQQAIEQLFGKFQFARMNALFQNLGKQGSQTLQVLDLMKASSQDLAAVAGRELSMVTESASGKYKRAIESLKADLAGLGDQFLKISTFFIKVVDGLLKFINNLPGPLKSVITLLAGFTALSGPLIMLTGVFANFIGYVIKGIGHMRALGRGGEGFKLLTPEILAAEQAGSLIEKTFYSDAQAAKILQTALSNLTNELTILQQKASAGSISVQPTLSTIQGGVVSQGAQRVADPNNPLIGKPYSRQMSHLNPVAGMTNTERASQTIFGVVPGPGPVNQRIGKNPQIYAEGDLPKIQGLTSINNVSTGIVAQEAAKWHSMTAALAMQSEAEIKLLKAEIAATGTVTTELSTSYQALLPQMTSITSMAAQEAKLIITELEASKINVDQARAKIIALNAQVEAMMVETTSAIATSQGRVANITSVPLTGQPVVDPTSGKTNMKEMFHKSKTSQIVDKVARALGVRTSGGGYSTHTTIPKRFAAGGPVYMAGGGPSGTDTVPAWLTEGEYVLKKSAVEKLGVPLLDKLNDLGVKPGVSAVQNSHASDSIRYAGHELSSVFGEHLPKGGYEFSQAMPNHAVQVYNSETLGLYDKENQALRPNHRGLTRLELIRALSAPNKRLFKSKLYKTLDDETQKVFKRRLLENASMLKEGRLYHDDTLAKIFTLSKTDTLKSLPPYKAEEFKRIMDLAKTPASFRPESFDKAAQAQGNIQKMTVAQAKAASGADPFYFMSPDSPNGKAGKYSVVYSGADGKKYAQTSMGTKSFKKSIRDTSSKLFGKWTNPFASNQSSRRVIQDLNSVMLNKKWARGFESGGLVGSSHANAQRYGIGGVVTQNILGMAGATGAGILGQKAGESVAGDAGGMVGSMLGSGVGFALPTILQSLVKGGGLNAARAAIMGINLPLTATIVTLTTLAVLWKKHNDQLKLTSLGYNLTEDAITKAGGKYKNLSVTLKSAIQDSKDLIEKNRLVYESLANSGTPLKMTVEEYKKLKSEVKSTMPELIKLVNSTKGKDLGNLGERLKAQFITAGMSAEDATKKIYTLISLSNKADVAGRTISSSGFRSISDPTSAAVASVKQINKTVSAKDTADQTVAAIKAISNAIDESVKKGKDFSDASSSVLSTINQQAGTQKTLSLESINNIQKQIPELKNVLNLTDTGTSAWAKYQLMIQGVTKDLDTMSGKAAIALQKANAAIEKSTRSTLTNQGGSLYNQNEKLKKYNLQIEALKKQAAGQSAQSQINAKEEIKSINKKIDAINKEYDARKKALSLQQQTEDANIAIQKAQLDYQNAISSGDMASAAQAQLNLRGIVGQRQNQLAQDALETARQAKLKPLEDRKTALSESQDKLANSASLASEKLTNLEKSAQDLKDAIDAVVSARSNIEKGLSENPNYLNTKEGKEALATYYQSESTNNPNNPNLKGLKKYSGFSPRMGMQLKSPVSLGRQLYKKEQTVELTKQALDALSEYQNTPKLSKQAYNIAPYSKGGGYVGQMQPSFGKPTSTIIPKRTALSTPSFDVPKTFANSSIRSDSSTVTSGGAVYNMSFVVNDSKMDPEGLWQFMQNKIKLTNTKSGIGRSK